MYRTTNARCALLFSLIASFVVDGRTHNSEGLNQYTNPTSQKAIESSTTGAKLSEQKLSYNEQLEADDKDNSLLEYEQGILIKPASEQESIEANALPMNSTKESAGNQIVDVTTEDLGSKSVLSQSEAANNNTKSNAEVDEGQIVDVTEKILDSKPETAKLAEEALYSQNIQNAYYSITSCITSALSGIYSTLRFGATTVLPKTCSAVTSFFYNYPDVALAISSGICLANPQLRQLGMIGLLYLSAKHKTATKCMTKVFPTLWLTIQGHSLCAMLSAGLSLTGHDFLSALFSTLVLSSISAPEPYCYPDIYSTTGTSCAYSSAALTLGTMYTNISKNVTEFTGYATSRVGRLVKKVWQMSTVSGQKYWSIQVSNLPIVMTALGAITSLPISSSPIVAVALAAQWLAGGYAYNPWLSGGLAMLAFANPVLGTLAAGVWSLVFPLLNSTAYFVSTNALAASANSLPVLPWYHDNFLTKLSGLMKWWK